jgi:hypothetical protein
MSPIICETCYEFFNSPEDYLAHYRKEHDEPTYSHDLDLSTVACTACSTFNLETELCFNCKSFLECVNCCGCEE